MRMPDFQDQDASAVKKQAAAVTAFPALSHCDFASCSLARKNLFQTALRTFKKVPNCDHHQQQHLRRDIIHANYRTRNERTKKNNILEAFLLRSFGKSHDTILKNELFKIKTLDLRGGAEGGGRQGCGGGGGGGRGSNGQGEKGTSK